MEEKQMENPSQTVVPSRNQLIVSALSFRLKSDPNNFQGDILERDIKSLCETILMSLQSGHTLESDGEVMKWIAFAENFPIDYEACLTALNEFNGSLASKSVLVGGGLTPSEADIIVFAALYSLVKGLSDSDRESLPHLMRWMDHIQNTEYFGETFEQILVAKVKFEPPPFFINNKGQIIVDKGEADSNVKKIVQGLRDMSIVEKGSSSNNTAEVGQKIVDKGEVDSHATKTVQGMKDTSSIDKGLSSNKTADVEKVRGDNQATKEKKKLTEKVADEKDKDVSVSLLKIQVGLIRKAWKHPSADSLLVEEIDTGGAKLRQVVSGLAKYCSPDDLTNRLVVLITNVKPGKLRDVMSEGLVLCASNEDHTVVEPIIPPEGAKVGESVLFSGYEGKPEDVLNPKKKQLEKITPHLFTDEKGVAMFKGIPFMTSGGPCTSSIPNATIK